MRNIKLTIEYDGTGYAGFQSQAIDACVNRDASDTPLTAQKGRTIQGLLEAALTRLCGEQVKVIGAGRTDAGVHALGQVVSFKTFSTVPLRAFAFGLNTFLPRDILVKEAREVPETFHARYSAVARLYRYYILTGEFPSPILTRYHCYVRRSLDFAAMVTAAAYLVGTHDFLSFKVGGGGGGSTRGTSVCQVNQATWEKLSLSESYAFSPGRQILSFSVEADRFLHSMVRVMVGTILEVGMGKRKPEEMEQIVHARDRRAAGATAPPHGLFLVKVKYPEDVPDGER